MNLIYLTPQLWQTEEVNDLTSALVAFQQAFDKVSLKKDAKNPHLRNQYLSLDNIINTVRPLLVDAGLTIVQDLAGDYLTTVIYHTSGQFRGSAMPFSPMAGNAGTNILQQLGGGITYAKRYALSAALCISVDTDDDGQSAKIQPAPVPVQKEDVPPNGWPKLLKWVNADLSRIAGTIQKYKLTQDQINILQALTKPK
jgi:hypothetical protein